jgi:signal transduction histidine kinase/CheY-like chemotaxis protein
MNRDAHRETLGQTIAEYRDSVERELGSGAARWAVGSIALFGVAILLVGMTTQNPIDQETFSVPLGVLLVAALAYLVSRHSSSLAAAIVAIGMLVLLLLVLRTQWASVAAPWGVLVVLTSALVAGRRYGAVVAVVVTVALAACTQLPESEMTVTTAINAASLGWVCFLFYSAISWPGLTLLDWTLSSYLQASEQTEEARRRQAELARLSKGLGEYQYQLEQLNLELDRARRAAQKAHELKAQFAAWVSHELRTPLNLIIGFCEMMVISPDSAYGQHVPASYRADLETIYRNACHMASLVDDILDLSQIDADRMAIHREWTVLGQVADEATSTVEGLFRDRELTLQTSIPTGLPPVLVDRTRIRQILINLLANAARFTEEGGVTIRAEQQDDSVHVTVSDTGPGIPVDQQPYVFDEFRQVAGTAFRKGGSGLGLAVSKRFAELHGGTMSVRSMPGEGSTFLLTLPLGEKPSPDGRVAASDWGDWVGRRVSGQADNRVLVLDESDRVRRVFERYLDGYQVIDGIPGNDREGLPRNAPIHAIMIGSEEGYSSLARLQRSRPDLENVLVVSYALHTLRSLAGEMGVTDYLVKPVTRPQLRLALKRLGSIPRSALVVDDDAEMNRLLVRMMRSLCVGCEIRTASDGREAVSLLRERRPDVVLLDLLMPISDGYAVVDAIHGDPSLGSVPVIVITARGLQDETMTASTVSLSRAGGLTVGEMMRWITGGLDALLERAGSGPASPEAPAERTAS